MMLAMAIMTMMMMMCDYGDDDADCVDAECVYDDIGDDDCDDGDCNDDSDDEYACDGNDAGADLLLVRMGPNLNRLDEHSAL